MVGNREVTRSFGASEAEGDWIYIIDDDARLLDFDMETFEETASKDFDFIHFIAGRFVWLFRKGFFQKMGGYDTKVWYGDGYDITYRARKQGKRADLPELRTFDAPRRGSLKMRWKRTFLWLNNVHVLLEVSLAEARIVNFS